MSNPRCRKAPESVCERNAKYAAPPGGEIRPKIKRPVLLHSARKINPGKLFRSSKFYVRISLVIPQHHVKFGPVLLDKIVFERQSFARVVHQNGFKIGNLPGQRTGFCINPARFQKIRGTRLRSETALPTYSTLPPASLNRYTPGASGNNAAFSRGSIIFSRRPQSGQRMHRATPDATTPYNDDDTKVNRREWKGARETDYHSWDKSKAGRSS